MIKEEKVFFFLLTKGRGKGFEWESMKGHFFFVMVWFFIVGSKSH